MLLEEQEFCVQEQESEISKLKERLQVESSLRKEYQVCEGGGDGASD